MSHATSPFIAKPLSLKMLGLSCAALALCALPASAQTAEDSESEKQGMEIGVSTHFGQNWPLDMLSLADEVDAHYFRDTIRWGAVEPTQGYYVFEEDRTTYPEKIEEVDGDLSLTINWGNDLYDNGHTPYTDEGRIAQARFINATLNKHKNIKTVEIGNEFNGDDFVTGPILEQDSQARAESYVEMLEPIHRVLKLTHPDVTILGGAAHSIPVGYFKAMFESGGGKYMDGLAIHPYTTLPEQLERQLAYLRSTMPDPDMPIHVTEFGTIDPDIAASYLVRMYCIMSASDIERAVWYPLRRQGTSNSVPLVSAEGVPTAAGNAYYLVQNELTSQRVKNISPDPFTYVFQANPSSVVIWGEPRSLTIRNDAIQVFNAEGRRIDAPGEISMDQVLILIANDGIDFENDIALGSNNLIADSYHQFQYVDSDMAAEDPFERFFLANGERRDAQTFGGGERAGTVWTPYLGNRYLRPARITADDMVPAIFNPGTDDASVVSTVNRLTADKDMRVSATSTWLTGSGSEDGVTVTIRHNDETLREEGVMGETAIDLQGIDLQKGDTLDFIMSPNASATGDTTGYRIQIYQD